MVAQSHTAINHPAAIVSYRVSRARISIRASQLVFITLFTFLILVAPAFSQGTLKSEITPGSGHIDDLFIFTVTYEGQQERINPQLSTGGDFQVQLLGPKTSISIVNGQIFARQQFVYQLTPKREGNLQTPEVQATVSGQSLSAPPISVLIKSQGVASSNGAFNGDQAEQIFMRQSANPESAYLGQQIVNAITVYTRVNLRGVRIEDDAADGFWQETISDGNNAQRTVNGVEYGSAQILRAIFALKTGTLKIPARQALVQVPVTKKSNPLGALDPFSDDFFQNFFQRTVIQEKKLTSNELNISVKPLPHMPQELSRFSNGIPIVGQTSITSVYSDSPIKVGETKNLSITVNSLGHLNPLKSIGLSAPTGVKVYDGPSKVKHDPSQGLLLTEKTFTYSLVPMQPGIIRIPGPSLSYFDPESGTYKLTSASDISFIVSGTPTTVKKTDREEGVFAPSSTENIQQNSAPLSPAGSQLPYFEKTTWESLSELISLPLSLLALTGAVLVVGLIWLWGKGSERLKPVYRSTKAICQAKDIQQLEAGIKIWAAKNLDGVGPLATFDEIRSAIRTSSKDKSHALSLIAVLDEIEISRYGKGTERSLEQLKKQFLTISSL